MSRLNAAALVLTLGVLASAVRAEPVEILTPQSSALEEARIYGCAFISQTDPTAVDFMLVGYRSVRIESGRRVIGLGKLASMTGRYIELQRGERITLAGDEDFILLDPPIGGNAAGLAKQVRAVIGGRAVEGTCAAIKDDLVAMLISLADPQD